MAVLPGYKWLEVVSGRRGGRPTVKGTRVSVDDILEMLAAGWKPEEFAEEFGTQSVFADQQVNGEDMVGIDAISIMGVALKAIQALSNKVEKLEAELGEN